MANFHVKNLSKPTPPLLKRISKSLIALSTTLTGSSLVTWAAADDEKIKKLAFIVMATSVGSGALGTLILNMFGVDENDTPTT